MISLLNSQLHRPTLKSSQAVLHLAQKRPTEDLSSIVVYLTLTKCSLLISEVNMQHSTMTRYIIQHREKDNALLVKLGVNSIRDETGRLKIWFGSKELKKNRLSLINASTS